MAGVRTDGAKVFAPCIAWLPMSAHGVSAALAVEVSFCIGLGCLCTTVRLGFLAPTGVSITLNVS